MDVTSGTSGTGTGGGRHRDRFSEQAKSLAAILTGIAALLTGIAGMIMLVCRDPAGNPASAVTTTAVGTQDTPAAGAPEPSATTPSSSSPAPPVPQWEGVVQVNPLGYTLATVPPRPDQSGDPDISAAFDGSFFAGLGAARWTGTATPSPRACATLILATHVTAVTGDTYCVRIAHNALTPGNQYASVLILDQGLDSSDLPYVRIHATVWPDQE